MNEDLSTETQKKVYTIWANNILSKRGLVIVDLFEDLKDGVLLINLLEILTSDKFESYNNNKPRNRLHQLSNVQMALNFIERWGINLVNFRPEHLVDKNVKMILSLIWRIISRFQIQQQLWVQAEISDLDSVESDAASDDGSNKYIYKSASRSMTQNNLLSSASGGGSASLGSSVAKSTPKEVLFRWCKKELEVFPSISITNFNKSFQNAQVLYSLVQKFLPVGVSSNDCPKEDDIDALQRCLETAERTLAIPQLLSAQQIIEGPIDENCIMTYVSYFLNYQRNGTTIPIVSLANSQQQSQFLIPQPPPSVSTSGSSSIGANNNNSGGSTYVKSHYRASSTGSSNEPLGNTSTPANGSAKPLSPNINVSTATVAKKPILKRAETGSSPQTPEKAQLATTSVNGSSTPISSPMPERSPRTLLTRQLSSSQIQTSPNSLNASLNDILSTFTQELKRITEEHEQMIINTTSKLDEKVSRLADKLDLLENKILSIKEVVDKTTSAVDDHHKRRHSKKIPSSSIPVATTPTSSDGNTTPTNTSAVAVSGTPTSTSSSSSKHKRDETKEERRERRRSKRKDKKEKSLILLGNGATENKDSLSPSSSSCSLTDEAQVDREEIKRIIRVQSIFRGFMARKQYKKVKTRRGVAQEILRTEESYVANLKILLTDYLMPLKTEVIANHSTLVDAVKSLYTNIEIIHNMNNMLLMKLKERMAKPWHFHTLYGDIFFKMSDLLKCYIAYVNHYTRTLNTINDFTKHQSLNEIISTTFNKTRQQLRDLVIIPVQRIPRYVLLLEELVKATEVSHPDHTQLTQALTKMQSIADHVNEKRRDFENISHVSLLQEAIIGFNIMEYSSLRYVMEGDLMSNIFTGSGSGFGTTIAGVVNNAVNNSSQEQSKGAPTTLHVFLFNQMIVVCKYKKGKDSYFTNKALFGTSSEKHKSKQPKYKYLSHHFLYSDTKISHNKSENWFGIENNNEYRRFFAKTVAEKDMWIQHIQQGISKATEIKNIKSTR